MKHWFLGMLLAASPLISEAKLFKWVDSQGHVHYSDTMPETQAATKGTSELNQRGVVVKPAESPEQKANRLAAEKKQKEIENEQKRQALKDKALKDTYSSTVEIDKARDRNIEQVDAAIKTNQARSKAASARLGEYQKQTLRFVKLKKPIPADLTQDIENTKQEISSIDKQILERQKEKQAIAQQAEQDKKRLKEILGLP